MKQLFTQNFILQNGHTPQTITFNPDLNQAQKIIFSQKMTKSIHSQIYFNIYISAADIYLSEKLNLYSYLVRNFQINAREQSAFSTREQTKSKEHFQHYSIA